jgi:hypothetical protein
MGWRIGYTCRHSIMGSPQVPVRILMQLVRIILVTHYL